MAIGIVASIVEAIMDGPEGSKYATMSIAGISPKDSSRLLLKERAFQYWPETITDTIDIGWSFKDIPGASSALAQWASNSGRTITFDVQLHRFMKPRKNVTSIERVRTFRSVLLTAPDSAEPMDQRPHNVDIAAEIRFLRAFCYPTFGDQGGFIVTSPPPIAYLSIPGLPLNDLDGSSVITAVMTGCDVTYTLLFPDGTPRRATVSLTFRQVVQKGTGDVVFRGHPDYNFGPGDENLAPGGLPSPGTNYEEVK